jgi:ABC-type glycerol-3-phosphate transport system substrate-binding protein
MAELTEANVRLKLLISLVFLLIGSETALGQGSSPDLVAQAKKEGRVTWYTTVSIPESKQLVDIFEKQHPFIKVDLLRSGSGPLVNRIVNEYAARNYSADVLHGMSSRGTYTILKQKNILAATNRRSINIFPPI